ncbi:hypothetical protein NIES2109_13640 [Nostoc sp. HK-01]|nr:hypothetical protein NIES2109_13640 [Nostoc sp. HK-01]
MSDQELKRYLLNHREYQEAFYVYMDRRKARHRDTAIELDDPAWEEKIIALIHKQLGSS